MVQFRRLIDSKIFIFVSYHIFIFIITQFSPKFFFLFHKGLFTAMFYPLGIDFILTLVYLLLAIRVYRKPISNIGSKFLLFYFIIASVFLAYLCWDLLLFT